MSRPAKVFIIFIGILIAATAAISVWWKIAYPSSTYRYRMTVSVETPEGIKTGSAVREINVVRGWSPLPEMTPSTKVTGEAVVVDLGSRGVLFGLMRSASGDDDYGHRVFFKNIPTRDYRIVNPNQKVILPPEQYPMFVTFSDMNDPKTVKLVNFESDFGAEVHFKEVTIEATNDSVTEGTVAKYRPPYGPETGFMVWFKALSYDDPRRFLPDVFARRVR